MPNIIDGVVCDLSHPEKPDDSWCCVITAVTVFLALSYSLYAAFVKGP